MSQATTFQTFSNQHKQRIDRQLYKVFTNHIKIASQDEANEPYCDLLKELRGFSSRGGKRLRPLLCLLAYESYGGQAASTAIRLAAAQELLHMFLVIHDDIIDQDCQRWGGTNISGVYFERFSVTLPTREALHMAHSWALLAGDACHALAQQAVSQSGLPSEITIKLLSIMQQITIEVLTGELADCAASLPSTVVDSDVIVAIYINKTASYSFRLPLLTGAIMAGAPLAEQQRLIDIANHIGIAYQLRDDILGIFGDAQEIGKSVLSDLREGKRTVMIMAALARAKDTDSRELAGLLGRADASLTELNRAQAIIRNSGALNYTNDLIVEHSDKGAQLIAKTAMDHTGKQRLLNLIAQLQTRKS